jgi:hypothetical protein
VEFIPFKAPDSDHDPFHTGLSAEKGVTPKGLVDGVNAYFTHIFQVMKGDIKHAVEVVDDDARTALLSLAEHVTTLEKKMETMTAAFAALAPQPAPGGAPAVASSQEGEDPQSVPPAPNQPPNIGGAASALQAALNKATGQ